MKRLLILNSKGGCGKTTIATNLAGYYAASGTPTALLDYDPQGSSKRWLEQRSEKLSNIHGVFAAKSVQGAVTRSFAQRVPGETRRIVVDTPASMKRMDMMEMLRSASAVIVPVLPSAIDRHVTVDFLRELTTLCRQMGIKIPGADQLPGLQTAETDLRRVRYPHGGDTPGHAEICPCRGIRLCHSRNG
ncbi:MAG: ParA family protein [Candidatus Thiodiazotropha sp.]